MRTESQDQPQRVSAADLSASAEELRQGLENLDALLAEAEEAVKRLLRKPRRKKPGTGSDT